MKNGSSFQNHDMLIRTLSWHFFQLVWVILNVLFETPNISTTFYLEIAIFCENHWQLKRAWLFRDLVLMHCLNHFKHVLFFTLVCTVQLKVLTSTRGFYFCCWALKSSGMILFLNIFKEGGQKTGGGGGVGLMYHSEIWQAH